MTSPSNITENTTVPIKIITWAVGLFVTGAIGFGTYIVVSLGTITTELKLMRQEFAHHTDAGHHTGSVGTGSFQSWRAALETSNPTLTIPDYYNH